MKADVITPLIISAASATASISTDTEPPDGQCALCGQPLDPELDGSQPVCTDCRVETTKATKTTKRRDPRC